MNGRLVLTLARKDILLYFRDRFFALITLLGLVFYAIIYFLMPATVDETLKMGIVAPQFPQEALTALNEGGVTLIATESDAALRRAILDGDFLAGASFPNDASAELMNGSQVPVVIYFSADLPSDVRPAYVLLLQEMAYNLTGRQLRVTPQEEVLGTDMAGRQVPERDRMLPLFAVFVLMVETLGLASLISAEIEGRTLQALMVTPLGIGDLFAGKGITGVSLAFVQATALLLVTGGLQQRPLLVLLVLLAGSLLVTGTAFLLASVSRDMMSVMAWGILVILVFTIPAFDVLMPGAISDWIKLIPSYYLVDAVYRIVNVGAGWAAVATNLLVLFATAAAFLIIGAFALKEKFA
jgi:ABC-2 type transport system permease protein